MNAWKDGADARIGQVIADELEERLPLVKSWVLVVGYVDDDDVNATAFNAAEGQRRTETLGLLTHALEVEKAAVIWDERPGRE